MLWIKPTFHSYICAREHCDKGISTFPIISLSPFLKVFFPGKTDILLDSTLTFKLRFGENEQVGSNLPEVRLVLEVTIQRWT